MASNKKLKLEKESETIAKNIENASQNLDSTGADEDHCSISELSPINLPLSLSGICMQQGQGSPVVDEGSAMKAPNISPVSSTYSSTISGKSSCMPVKRQLMLNSSPPNPSSSPLMSQPESSPLCESKKLRNLIDGVGNGFVEVETGLKVSLYHLSKGEIKETEYNLEKVKRLNKGVIGKFNLFVKEENLRTIALKQDNTVLKQRETRLLQDLRKKDENIKQLERKLKAERERSGTLEKKLIADNMGDINFSEEFDDGSEPKGKANTGDTF